MIEIVSFTFYFHTPKCPYIPIHTYTYPYIPIQSSIYYSYSPLDSIGVLYTFEGGSYELVTRMEPILMRPPKTAIEWQIMDGWTDRQIDWQTDWWMEGRMLVCLPLIRRCSKLQYCPEGYMSSIYYFVWVCMRMYRYLWVYWGMYGYVWVCKGGQVEN